MTVPAPPAGRRRPATVTERLGLASLLGYAATALPFAELGEDFKVAMLVVGFGGFFWSAGHRRWSAPVWLLVAAVLIALLSWGLARLHHPQWAESSPKVHRLTHWFTFIAVAWLLAGRIRRVFAVWGAALLGLLAAPWITGRGLTDWQQGLGGARVDFGLHNAQHTTLLFATALLGLVVFAGRWLGPGPWRPGRALAWLAATLLCAVAVVISQTRGIWLGGAAAAGVLLIGVWWGRWRSAPPARRRRILAGLLAGALVCTLSAASFAPIIGHRLAHEHQSIEQLLDGELPDDTGSVAGRVLAWAAAGRWIAERPLLGWGGNGRGLVLEHSPQLPAWMSERGFGHLHNSYLDTLVNFGVAGLALLAALLGWLTVYTITAWRRGRLAGDFLLFYLAFLAFWLVVNLFESFLFFSSGDLIFALVAGGMVSRAPPLGRS